MAGIAIGTLLGAGVHSLLARDKPLPNESERPTAVANEQPSSIAKPSSAATDQTSHRASSTNDGAAEPAPLEPAEFADVALLPPELQPNTPAVYIEMLSPPTEYVTLADLHLTFAHEPRDGAWAYGVESAISTYIAENDVASHAVFEHVECRKYTCELAGYYVGRSAVVVSQFGSDPDFDARDVLDGVDAEAWWHTGRTSYSMGGNPDGLPRFLIIVTGADIGERGRPAKKLW
ncbi:MAG: hypothetical protein AAFM91_03335 [Pseudomonadota bacterium]